ncbi:MAG: hypothetical protein IK151_01200 [Erysipelotrichaceae bacterium]|nr:hypothetical protein [Erysipelotrichaceae bacterium]
MSITIPKGDYKQTDTYKNADQKTKARIERFRKENQIENGHMYLLLLREDIRNLPKEEKQRGNRMAEMLVVCGIITFMIMTSLNRRDILPYAGLYMFVVTGIYFSGILNPVSRKLSNINRLLKKHFPEKPSLSEYLKENEEE